MTFVSLPFSSAKSSEKGDRLLFAANLRDLATVRKRRRKGACPLFCGLSLFCGRLVILFILAAGLMGTGIGCNNTPSPDSGQKGHIPVVSTKTPERKTLRRVIEQPGHIEAFEETPLYVRIPGFVQKVHVDIGDTVEGPRYDAEGKLKQYGQVLAELWVPEMDEELKQKQALVVQAEAEVEQAKGALAIAEANIVTAKAMVREAEAGRTRAQANYERWESEFKRVDLLVQRKVVDEQTRDETRNQYKAADAARLENEAKIQSAQAGALESEARRNKARADLTAAEARVQVAQAEAARLAALLQYSKVRAPYDGVVTRRNVHTGHFLQPVTASKAAPVLVVARTDKLRIAVHVPEIDVPWISENTPARIRVLSIKDQDFPGKVSRTSWSLDSMTRTLRTEVDLTNTKMKLRPGMYAYVALSVELPGRLTVPASAVSFHGDHAHCYTVEEGKAVRTPVQVGARDGNFVEILKKQAKGGTWDDFTGKEEIVQNNLSDLTDGQEVQAKPAGE